MEKTTYVNFPRKQGEDEEALPKYILKELMKTRQESEGKNWDTGENKQAHTKLTGLELFT